MYTESVRIQYNTKEVIVPSHVQQHMDCALQNVSERLRTKSNVKKTCLKCSSACGVIVDEPHSSSLAGRPFQKPAADRKSTSPELRSCPTDNTTIRFQIRAAVVE